MDKTSGILRFFQWICRFNFGNFEKDEFKKFLRMGAIFALMIGVYWTLRPLKDAVFIQLVGKYSSVCKNYLSYRSSAFGDVLYEALGEDLERKNARHSYPLSMDRSSMF